MAKKVSLGTDVCLYSRVAALVLTLPDNHYWRMGNFIAKAWSVGTEVEKA
ncbi:MAG TPA: hypothetical protein PK364_11710 [Synergistaceae bacterium]|nr:hypothetical protein [Synergistaceae bacterium]HPJ26559.1 hypothetical protein [Synergistaceae bacterium]HPQ38266.1 hypothetical protein [Synergistaceae bacterium]